jgi:hypothetical protein
MPANRFLPAMLAALTPGIAAADAHGQGASQFRNGPFNEFDLKAIGIALVVVMVILGIRALKRRRS